MERKIDKRTIGSTVVDVLKTIGFIIWSTLPLMLTMSAIGLQKYTPIYLQWGISLILIAFILFSIRWLWRYYRKHTAYFLQKLRLKDIAIAVGLFIFLRGIAIGGTLLNTYVTGNEMTSNDAALQASDPLAIFPMYFIVFNLVIGLVAPILEELAFRGIFIDTWFNVHKKWLPAVITSSIFALAHGFDNFITFSMYFIMGLTFFFAYYRRHNIKDSILLHMLNNILMMIVSFVSYAMLYFN
ncbi:lysostaphin resistance A-like protein [Enterococcus sp. DIV1444a]|uniref:CPBP family intramembrane glutamic endopeptidase n=1 Tax=Enterococcus sp. DIV1444a TaxID=2774679 RepID=UPI003F29C36C